MRILLTGGGTGGHIIPNFAIIDQFRSQKIEVQWLYVGSQKLQDRQMVEDFGIDFKAVSCGKLRRYFSWENFVDFFRIPVGILQALKIVHSYKPDLIFSKGGYVSVPVVVAARILGKKIFVHESDLVPGLANRICAKLANKVLVSFPESVRFFKDQNKVVVTGNPVRCSICNGSKSKGYALTKFQKDLPTILVMGGSQGAQQINKLVRKNLKKILPIAQIIHICGEQKKGLALDGLGLSNYVQYEFVKDELPHLYAIADIVVSRAGANSLSEIIALKKPAILIPLSTQSSRGDQIQNAKLFKKHKLGFVLENNEANAENFFSKIEELIKTPKLLQEIQMNFEKLTQTDASVEIVKLIKKEFGI